MARAHAQIMDKLFAFRATHTVRPNILLHLLVHLLVYLLVHLLVSHCVSVTGAPGPSQKHQFTFLSIAKIEKAHI